DKWSATSAALIEAGVEEVIARRVLGRGKQRGLRYLRRRPESEESDMPYLPKRLLVCFVPDELVQAAVDGIVRVNRSGNFGDGKTSARPVASAAGESVTAAETAAAGV